MTENVAYNSIKKLIKDHTTPGRSNAVSIPGQSDTVDSSFEDELFDLLIQQHNNVNLFVRSKSGEIDRRLGMFDALLDSCPANNASPC